MATRCLTPAGRGHQRADGPRPHSTCVVQTNQSGAASLALHRESWSTDCEFILDGFDAGRGPRRVLSNAALVPGPDIPLEHNLAVHHVDADGIRFEFCVPL